MAEVKVMYKKVDPSDTEKIAERDEELNKIKEQMEVVKQ